MNVELSSLLHPISDATRCGEDLSFSNAFHDIKKAKTQDDPLLEQGDWLREPKQADWSFVASKSTELLIHKSKDIRLLTWLTEAWSHLYGFEGIAAGLALSHQMLQQFWTDIHPTIEDQDLDQRLGLLQGLLNPLPQWIKQVALNQSQQAYSLLDYEKLLHQQNNRLKYADETESAEPSLEMEQFEQALAATPKNILVHNSEKFNEILQHWQQIKHILNQLMQHEAPSFAQIESQLESIHKNLKKVYKIDTFASSDSLQAIVTLDPSQSMQQVVTTPVYAQDPSSSPAQIQTQTQTQSQSPTQKQIRHDFIPQAQNHLHNREQAMLLLQQISDYFEKNEPHSPVSYMLKKTIKWSQLPLHEWLTQVIKNESPLESIQDLLGVTPPHNQTNHG